MMTIPWVTHRIAIMRRREPQRESRVIIRGETPHHFIVRLIVPPFELLLRTGGVSFPGSATNPGTATMSKIARLGLGECP